MSWLKRASVVVCASALTALVVVVAAPFEAEAGDKQYSPGEVSVAASAHFRPTIYNAGSKEAAFALSIEAEDGTWSADLEFVVAPGDTTQRTMTCQPGISCTGVPVLTTSAKRFVVNALFTDLGTNHPVFLSPNDWKLIK